MATPLALLVAGSVQAAAAAIRDDVPTAFDHFVVVAAPSPSATVEAVVPAAPPLLLLLSLFLLLLLLRHLRCIRRGRIGYRHFSLLTTSVHSFDLRDFSTVSASLVVAGVIGSRVEGAAGFVVGGGGAGFFNGTSWYRTSNVEGDPPQQPKCFFRGTLEHWGSP